MTTIQLLALNWTVCEYCEFVQETYDFSLKDGKKVAEDVDVSVKDNFVQYHLEQNNTEVWVLNDFNTVSECYRNSFQSTAKIADY